MVIMVGLLIGLAGGIFLGLLIGTIGEDSKRSMKEALASARQVIGKVGDISRRYNSQLDIAGQAMVDEVTQEINTYWRGIKP